MNINHKALYACRVYNRPFFDQKKSDLKTTILSFFLLSVLLLACAVLYFTTEHTLNKSLWSALALVAALALHSIAASEQKSM